MVALLAVTAVAAMLIPPPSPVVQAQGGTCANAQTPGRLADLTFKTEDNTTWEIGKTNTFRSRGPYVGSVQVDATAGIEVSTDPAFSCGSGAQALTLQKGAGPTEIHVQRCDPEQRHIEFTTVLIDGCNGQIRTVYTWKWLEPTDAPVGISQQDYQQPNRETPGAPTTSSMSSSTCNGQNQNGGSNSPEALNPQETHRSEADGPGPTRVPYSIVDAQKAHRKALDMLYKVRKGAATPEEAQEAADTLWLMSQEFRVTNISYDYAKTGRLKLLCKLLRQWVIDEGLELLRRGFEQTCGLGCRTSRMQLARR